VKLRVIGIGTVSTDSAVAAGVRDVRSCHKSKSGNSWHRSHFGSHPRMVVTTQHSGVSLLDLRVSISYFTCKSFCKIVSSSANLISVCIS